MIKFNSILLLTCSFMIYNVGMTVPVSELAGMHQLDEGLGLIAEGNSICKDKKDTTLVADEHDKSKFYECNNGMAFPLHCPNSLIFDPNRLTCELDSSSSTTHIPYHSNSTFNCSDKKDAFYSDEKDTTKFHECRGGYPYDFQCPTSTVFDVKRNACTLDSSYRVSKDVTMVTSINPTTNRVTRDLESTTNRFIRDLESTTNRFTRDVESTTTMLGTQQTEQSSENDKSRHARSTNQLEQVANGKHIDLHQMETTTRENFDLLDLV